MLAEGLLQTIKSQRNKWTDYKTSPSKYSLRDTLTTCYYNPQNEMFRVIKTKRFGIKTKRMLFEHRSNSVRMQQSGVKKRG